MGRAHWIVLGGAFALLLFLFFGLETRAPEFRNGGPGSGGFAVTEATSVDVLKAQAFKGISDAEALQLEVLNKDLEAADSDASRVELLKKLSGLWYQFGYPAIAGHYALEVGEVENTEAAWSIAGSTFALGLQRAKEEKVKKYCAQNAVGSFERAISLNPDEPAHRLNLALVYTDLPPSDNPMRGILMLRDLNREYPEYVPVLNALGRLALQTGQIDRAVERLEQALNNEPENPDTHCLLAQAYQASGETDKASRFAERCKGVRN